MKNGCCDAFGELDKLGVLPMEPAIDAGVGGCRCRAGL